MSPTIIAGRKAMHSVPRQDFCKNYVNSPPFVRKLVLHLYS